MSKLATKTFGIFLLHGKVLEFVARVIRQLLPQLLAHHVLFSVVLLLFGLGVPLAFMELIARSRMRSLYRPLFGGLGTARSAKLQAQRQIAVTRQNLNQLAGSIKDYIEQSQSNGRFESHR